MQIQELLPNFKEKATITKIHYSEGCKECRVNLLGSYMIYIDITNKDDLQIGQEVTVIYNNNIDKFEIL